MEINLDLLMSGKFSKVLKKLLAYTGIIFGVLVVAGFAHAWFSPGELGRDGSLLPGQLLLDLTNPTFESGAEAWTFWWISEHILVLLTNLVGIILVNGILLSFIVNWLSSRREKFGKGETRYTHFRPGNFSVIIGGHRMVAKLACDLIRKECNEYVLIQTQRNPEALRRELFAAIGDRELAGDVIIYSGCRTSRHELEELQPADANEVYIIGESALIDGANHDALNLECWRLIAENIAADHAPAKRIPCHVMFEYQSTFTAFQNSDVSLRSSRTFSFEPFSIYETWARQVLVSRPGQPDSYTPLDGHGGISYDSPERVHLIVVGMSRMGVALAIEAARTAHYPNFNNPAAGRPRTLITFIDRHADTEMLKVMRRYRALFDMARWRYVDAPADLIAPADEPGRWKIYDSAAEINSCAAGCYPWHRPLDDAAEGSPYFGGYLGEDFIGVDFEFIKGDLAAPAVNRYISDAAADTLSRTTIAICLPIASEAMAAALYFSPEVYEQAQEIWVQQAETGAIVETLRQGISGLGTARYRRLKPFGMLDRCDYLRGEQWLPKLVSYAYTCLNRGTSLFSEYTDAAGLNALAADATAAWEAIDRGGGKSVVAKRWSNVYCARSFPTKMRAFGLKASADEITDSTTLARIAEVEHNRWVIEQLLSGYRPVDRSYATVIPIGGALRNELKRKHVHPDIVGNSKLGPTRDYDIAIARIICLASYMAGELDADNQ
ncbi:MAG: hypothetical protein NC418_03840 [Muribaculaceae bacterium]|nr:hypothetical protein [Muribaculaceae bacterium]